MRGLKLGYPSMRPTAWPHSLEINQNPRANAGKAIGKDALDWLRHDQIGHIFLDQGTDPYEGRGILEFQPFSKREVIARGTI